jgi:hypothetical protein
MILSLRIENETAGNRNLYSPPTTVLLLQQHISLKTRNICLTFSSGIPLHSVVSYTEQSQAGRGCPSYVFR